MVLLILIDSRVPDVNSILETLTPETESIVFDYSTDTFETIQSKIVKPYSSVAIAQHKYGLPTFQLLASMSPALLEQLEQTEPELNSWSEFSTFILWLKDNGADTVDLLACDLWADMNWRYAIQKMRENSNMTIRASIDITGADGNFILESDNADMVGLYFTSEISNYKYNFYNKVSYEYASSYSTNYIPVTLPTTNPGIIPATSYSEFIGSVLHNSNSTPLLSDISGVISVTINSLAAVAVLRTDGSVVTYGASSPTNNAGGNSSSVQSQLYNITKIVCTGDGTNNGFAALRSDGVVIAWGVLSREPTAEDIQYAPDILYSNIKNTLVNVTNIWSTALSVIALTNTGKVITFGRKTFGGELPTSYAAYLSSGVIKVAVSRCAQLYIKSDGTAYTGGQAYGSTDPSFNTNPVIDGYVCEGEVFVVRSASDNTKQLTNITGQTLLYTMPAGVSIIREVQSYQYGKYYILLSNNVLLQITNSDTEPTVINNVTDIVVNEQCVAYLQNGSVVVVGTTASFGSNPNDATYGIPTGASLTNIRRLVSTQYSFGAITFDNNFIWWGNVNEPYSGSYTSTTFPTFDAKSTSIYNKLVNNVASVYSCQRGYVFTCLDGSMVSFGTTGFQYGNTTTNFATKNANKNVYFANNIFGFIPIDIPNVETASLSTNYQYAKTVVSYYNSNPDLMAISGRKYTLYNGSTVISTLYSINDTFTYTFSDVVFETLGNITLSIYDTPDFTTSKTLVGTFTVTIIVNPFITAPSSPTITSSVVGSKQLTVNFTEPDLSGGMPILGYKYSTNLGLSYTTIPSTARQFVISDIPSQNSTVLVKAYNVLGDSSYVEVVVTMYSTPNPPTITSVVPGSSQVQVYFTAGDMNFSTFAGYKYSTDGVNYYWTNETTSPITITGLTVGISYNITLKCVSENAGTSLASTQSASFTPYSVPIIPTISSVSIGDGVASVYYTDGSSNGSPITMHKYSLDGGNYIDVSSGSPITLSGLTNGKPYSVTIKSVNSAGTSNGSRPMVFVPYAVPSKPIILNVISSSNQATVYIQHGNDNGADIATYSYSLNNSAFVSTGNANTIFTISGLTNGTLYNIKVIASNAAGNSAVSEPYTITPSSVPNPPTNLVITAINEGISVSFTDGATNGAPINYYLYSLNGGQDIPAKKNTNGNIHIFDLLNGTNYSIKLKAVNNAGASNYSSAVNWFTRFERPIVPVVTNIIPGNGCAYVYFDETITNGSSVEQFYYSLNGLPPVPLNISQLTSPLTIPSLTNKRNYNISIASRIGGNISTVSNTKTVTVGVPLAPVITNVVPGFKNMKVYFNVPFNNGFPISDYVYGLNNNSIISKSSVLTDDDGSYLVISHLTNGRSYVPYLCAININGRSLQSNTLPSVKPGSIPNTISIVTVTPYLMGSLLYFNTPPSNGHPITKYKYAINDDTNFVDVSGISIPLAIYNTPINTPFTVRLIATNALGDTPASAPSRAVTFVYLPPSKIHIRSLKMPTKNSLLVSFYTPALNGSPITKYKYALNGSSQYIDVSGTTLPFLITQGIVPNVDYNISVIAVNSSTVNNGESIPSDPLAKPVRFKYLAPEKAPIIGSIVGGNTIAIVSVLSVELRGAPIIGYAYSTDGVNLIDIPNTVSSPLTITGLTNDISYNMRIAAKTEMGYSPLSIAQSVMPVYKVPNTPVIRYFVKGNRNLTVSFTVPASNGAPITGYKYRLNNGVKIPAVLNSDGKSFLITKNIVYGSDVLLANGATYNVQMLAINEVGESELSVTKSVTVN